MAKAKNVVKLEVSEQIPYIHHFGRKILIVGLQGSGKTTLVKQFFLRKQKYHLVIDYNDEYGDDYTRYIPKYIDKEDEYQAEISGVIEKLVYPNTENIHKRKRKKKKYLRLLVIDEADMLIPNRKAVNSTVRKLFVQCRHRGLDIITICRRIKDINTYIAETSDYIIAFKQVGLNDLKILRELSTDAEKLMKSQIDYHKHNFIVMPQDRKPYVINSFEEFEKMFIYP